MSKQQMRTCNQCGKPTLHIGPGTSHLLHFILAILTAGLWVPVWIIITWNNTTKLACSQCGKLRGVFAR